MSEPEAISSHKTIQLDDYRPSDYLIDTVNLQFDLDEEKTVVKSLMVMKSNYDRTQGLRPLVLQGRQLALRTVMLDNRVLGPDEYTVDDETFSISEVPDRFILAIENEINPKANTSLSGLYTSSGNFCTQCEAEGFRSITYFLDRPDVMTRFFTTITANKAKYPVLLSNGNFLGSGDAGGGRHFSKWHDPFPKPAYLFALVAGDLALIEDNFTTMSHRKVSLHIYVQHHNKDKCGHAMASLKKAMKWDEDVYGREYDLDLYMIVAVDDFNMGAMENKGLNIFNSKYILAKPETATDSDYQGIEGVVAHEYFHNWSGDRVTCRDWFQLSLKEGFTVFRDQQFMEDMTSKGVKRISDVNILRTHQFREDAGPLAHPVRPSSYVEINNFYTVTVYNKGAEVIRMMRLLLGPEAFRKGTDLYFSRHDGQAVTTDDFVRALEDAAHADLGQFRRWYTQAGTPEVRVTSSFDPLARTCRITLQQTCAPTPGQAEKEPFHIPVALGLIGKDGKDLVLNLLGDLTAVSGTRVLQLKKREETFVFTDIHEEPVASILRGFSAPVKVKFELTDEERLFLMACDSDEFSRWDAGQQLAVKLIRGLVKDVQQGRPLFINEQFIAAFRKILEADFEDKAFQACVLSLPSEAYLADCMEVIDPSAIHEARRFLAASLAHELRQSFLSLYHTNVDAGPYQVDPASVGRRSLKNLCLSYLAELEDSDVRRICVEQFKSGRNMTDVITALANLANIDCPEREEALASFAAIWKDDPLVMDKWLALQAMSRLPGTLDTVKRLTSHPSFSIKNPNKVRALIGAFSANAVRFHESSGAGYEFLADQVLTLDPLNPQIAARLASAFTIWKRVEEKRKALMKLQLERILKTSNLSKDVCEVASKSLA